MTEENLLQAVPGETPVSPAMGVAMIALNMALKYHDIAAIKDGTLYQQYKLEGRNIEIIHLDMVLETARKIERHLLVSSHEIATLMVEGVFDAIEAGLDEDPEIQEPAEPFAEDGDQ